MGSFLKLVLVLMVVYYILTRLGRFFFQVLTGPQQRGNQHQQPWNSQQQYRREGEIHITEKPKKEKRPIDEIDGEYIDYEEVK